MTNADKLAVSKLKKVLPALNSEARSFLMGFASGILEASKKTSQPEEKPNT